MKCAEILGWRVVNSRDNRKVFKSMWRWCNPVTPPGHKVCARHLVARFTSARGCKVQVRLDQELQQSVAQSSKFRRPRHRRRWCRAAPGARDDYCGFVLLLALPCPLVVACPCLLSGLLPAPAIAVTSLTESGLMSIITGKTCCPRIREEVTPGPLFRAQAGGAKVAAVRAAATTRDRKLLSPARHVGTHMQDVGRPRVPPAGLHPIAVRPDRPLRHAAGRGRPARLASRGLRDACLPEPVLT